MKILIDFDDVIFNTKRFKEDLKKIFLRFGVSEILYGQTYYDPDDLKMIKTYDPRKQIARIRQHMPVDIGKAAAALDGFMGDTSRYVFPDVHGFIGLLGKENIRILSYGDMDFQKEKIASCGIGAYLDDIFVTDKLKADVVAGIISGAAGLRDEKVFFLDDRIEQIHDVKEKFPEIIAILVKRPEGRYQDMQREECCNFEAHDLKEAAEIIKNMENNN